MALASEYMTVTPDLVNEDLEVAWQLLLQGLPDENLPGDEATPSPTQSTESMQSEGETPTLTPTPTPEP